MPPKTALLVIDMQEHFRPMTTTALPNILKLCQYFSQTLSEPVIFTQHGHSNAELTTVPSPSMLVRKWGPEGSIATGSPAWRLMDELAPYLPKLNSPPETAEFPQLVAKNTYDAFVNTDLATLLESARVERVIVCGVMTDCCCDTTARSAFNRGYETWLVSDACGSANERQHKAGLNAFGYAFGDVLTTSDVIRRLNV